MIDLIQKYADRASAVKLALSIEQLVREERIHAGALLPPVRALADAVGVSPGTAAAAYKTLRERGVVSADGRRGTRVAGALASFEYRDLPAPVGECDLRFADPDATLMPALAPLFAAIDHTHGTYASDSVADELRAIAPRALAGIPSEHLYVGGGAIGVLLAAMRANIGSGDKVGVEDPGYNEHHALVSALGCTAVAIAIDDQGPTPESVARAIKQGVRAIVLTPRAQSPFGATLTKKRARELRNLWHAELAVLVDDYFGLVLEQPYEDVVGTHGKWCAVRSFNKAIGPDIRVALAAGDAATIAHMRAQQRLGDRSISFFTQRVCAAAWAGAQKTFVKAARRYDQRRQALLAALARLGIEAYGASGINVWVPVKDEASVVAAMAAQGFHVRAGARYRLQARPAVRISTPGLDPTDAPRVAQALAAAMHAALGRRP